MGVKLQPSYSDTRLTDVVNIGKIEIPVKKLAIARGAGGVEAMVNNILPSIEAGLKDLRIADRAIKLQRAIQAGKHFVSFCHFRPYPRV